MVRYKGTIPPENNIVNTTNLSIRPLPGYPVLDKPYATVVVKNMFMGIAMSKNLPEVLKPMPILPSWNSVW